MAFLYHIMSCRVTIGVVQFDYVNSIQIMSSIKLLSDTAKITLPRNTSTNVLGKDQSLVRKSILDFIREGDEVNIELGYDGELESEFKGYVSRISADVPLLIECEDEMYWLRKSNFNETFKEVNLSELLNYIAPDYPHEVIDDINLGKFIIDNASAYEVLEAVEKDYLLHSYFKNGTLVVGFPVDIKPGVTHPYNMSRNVRNAQQLEFVKAEDVKLQVKAISNNRNGSKTVVTVGETGGASRTLNFANKTEDELRQLAQRNLDSLSFDGYQGSFRAFGVPRVKAGDAIEITDPEYPDGSREGKYLTESVEINYSQSTGWERIIKPSLSL